MRRAQLTCLVMIALAGCSNVGSAPQLPIIPELRTGIAPVLPDTSGWGIHVLSLLRAPNGTVWVGTYGSGIYELPPRKNEWVHHPATGDSTGITWGFINTINYRIGRKDESTWEL